MKARRLSFLIVGLTVLGLTAGVLAGLLAARLPIGAQVVPTGPGGVPASHLNSGLRWAEPPGRSEPTAR